MIKHRLGPRILVLLVCVCVLAVPGAARAAVQVAFYSKEFGVTFPHAFITVKGTLDASGEAVDASYGFTAKNISPAVLTGSVSGEVIPSAPGYIAKSDRHFAMTLNDEDYAKLMAAVDRWAGMNQPSYNLNRRNCVFFVAELAAAIGLKADTPKPLMKKPRSYLRALVEANRALLKERGAEVDD